MLQAFELLGDVVIHRREEGEWRRENASVHRRGAAVAAGRRVVARSQVQRYGNALRCTEATAVHESS